MLLTSERGNSSGKKMQTWQVLLCGGEKKKEKWWRVLSFLQMERGQRREHWLGPEDWAADGGGCNWQGECPIPGHECRAVLPGLFLSLSLGCRTGSAVLGRAAGGITRAPCDSQGHRAGMLTTAVGFRALPESPQLLHLPRNLSLHLFQ